MKGSNIGHYRVISLLGAGGMGEVFHVAGARLGREPRWSRDARELFYYSGDRLMGVTVATRGSFQAGKPTVLFTGFHSNPGARSNYAVYPDGKRFLTIMPSEKKVEPRQMNFVLNWYEGLRRSAPAGQK